jgi:hypothetical protein
MDQTVWLRRHWVLGHGTAAYLTAGSVGYPRRLILPLGTDVSKRSQNMYGHLLDSEFTNRRILKGWLTSCQTNHKHCSNLPNNGIGFQRALRFIDCFANEVVVAPLGCEYVALSYVWGGGPASTAIGQRLGPLETPPQTIKDAMVVTAQLQIRYLWVDQYCIDQSDSSEMQSQLSVMDLIYSEATLTIIAAAGTDASSGLPGISRPRVIVQPRICLDGTTWVSCLEIPETLIEPTRWYTRAWTFQEEVCSRRRLIFTEELIFFMCATFYCDETNDWAFHNTTFDSTMGRLGLHDFSDAHSFRNHIFRYTSRELSYQSDALNAMRGVFRLYKGVHGVGQHWGLPTDTLAAFTEGLLWSVAPDARPASRRKDFPSWSWAGWVVPVGYQELLRWTNSASRSTSAQLQFRFKRLDGTMTRSNEAFESSRIDDTQPESSIYTPIIHITAEVLTVRFTRFEIDLCSAIADCYAAKRYAVVIIENICWPFGLTKAIEESPNLERALFEDSFDVIVLAGNLGLVVWEYEGITERIGILGLLGYHSSVDLDQPQLRNYVPGRRKSILLN